MRGLVLATIGVGCWLTPAAALVGQDAAVMRMFQAGSEVREATTTSPFACSRNSTICFS